VNCPHSLTRQNVDDPQAGPSDDEGSSGEAEMNDKPKKDEPMTNDQPQLRKEASDD
jgi:hypothetical protein